jgi:hypothetical protein
MKSLLLGIIFVILVGIGGLVYRNAIEMRGQLIACPVDAKVCPDGTSVGRVGTSCVFPVCPPPNVTLEELHISFAIPPGFVEVDIPDAENIVLYERSPASAAEVSRIAIHQYPIAASSTALATIQATAVGDASGLPVSTTAFTSTSLGTHRFTVAAIGRFEGVITTAYYLARDTNVLRFDAIDIGVADWTDPTLDVGALPAHSAVRTLLGTLSGI